MNTISNTKTPWLGMCKSLMITCCLIFCQSAKAQHPENHTGIEEGKVSIFQSWPAQIGLPTALINTLFMAKNGDTVVLRFNDSLSFPAVKIMAGENVSAFKLLWGMQPVMHIERSIKAGRAFNGFIMHKDAADSYSIVGDPENLRFIKTGMERILVK